VLQNGAMRLTPEWVQLFSPGNYRLTIALGAANAEPIEKTVEINLTGNWPGVEIGPERVQEIVKFGISS
jgi:hypothetical protein